MHCSISLKNILISISAVFTVIGSIFLGVLIGLIPLQSCPSFSYGFLIPAIVIIGLFIGFILFLYAISFVYFSFLASKKSEGIARKYSESGAKMSGTMSLI